MSGTSDKVVIDQLTELNYKQASRIMELEAKLRTGETEMTYMDGSPVEDSLNNVVDFVKPSLKLITGGPPPEGPWLDRLSTGTCFLVRPKAFDGYLLREFCLGGRRDNATMLIIIDNGEKMRMDWVDPVRFCQQLDLYEITEEPQHED